MLPDLAHLILFMAATIILNLIPGSDVLFIGSQAVVNKKQGIFAVIGTSTGVIIWIGFTVIGLTEILHHSIWLFNLVKFAGAAYLLYLAWQAFFLADDKIHLNKAYNETRLKTFCKGILVNLSNPKVGLFFVTFLPQFVNQSRGFIWLQLLSLGICFITSGTIVNLAYALLFASVKDKFLKHLGFRKILNKLTGIIFLGLAIKIATAHNS
ncbi:MAG: LysE family translocator [Burkholderiales bacterium]|jgi:threonine/homoserine/homoserine lactone efflux protein|nr:LysE family translocator [Burkholderiales bacterium]